MFKIKPYSGNYIYKTAEDGLQDDQGEAAISEEQRADNESTEGAIGLVVSKVPPEGATLNIKYLQDLGGGRPVKVTRTEKHDEDTNVTTVTLTDAEWGHLDSQMPHVGDLNEAFG